jgi:putative tricarboxylic transport membrane protein
MQKLDVPIPPMVLALILGDTLEKTFRQAMVAKSGSLTVFLDKPIALTFIGMAAISILYSLYQSKKASDKAARAELSQST